MIDANSHQLNVEISGPVDGPTVVLLHHGLGSLRSWKEQIPALTTAGFRVIAYDRWGYGCSEPRPQLSIPYFEEDLADLGALLDELRIDRASLVGHSDGGTMALYFSALHPWRVARLVVAATHVYVEAKMKAGINEVRQAYESNARFQEGLHRLHNDKADSLFFNWYTGWYRPENLSWDIRPLISQIACPTLVIHATEDEHATLQHAQDIAREIPNAELQIQPGAGHMLPQDMPEAFNLRMLEFLKRETVNRDA
jgi:pimeloyl-ACP methyl ester carboxylesterase